MRYLEDDVLTPDELRAACAPQLWKLVPILVGSALKNKGVQLMLDAIVDYLRRHLMCPPVTGIDPKTGEKFVARSSRASRSQPWCSNRGCNPHVGKLAFVRVYSGQMEAGSYALNSFQGRT